MLSFDERYAADASTPVPNRFITEYMADANADQLKVYLYGLMCCTYPPRELTAETMAAALEMEQGDVRKALRHWEFYGLVERLRDTPPAYRFVHPAWLERTASVRQSDPVQEAFMEDLYAIFDGKRDLKGSDRRKAWEWVEELHLPPEAVLILVRHLKATRGPGFTFSGKEAVRLSTLLADEHARTAEEAAEILARDEQVENTARQVVKRFGQRRQPSLDEILLCRKWIRDWGFDADSILDACAETTKTSSPTFAYLDRVLDGIRTRAGSGSGAVSQDRTEHERVREVLDALGVRSRSMDGAARGAYRMLTEWCPHEVIVFAARECRGKGLDNLLAVLESWKGRGIRTLEQAEAYVDNLRPRRGLLRQLADLWGRAVPAGQQNMELAGKWLGEFAQTEELILHCARWTAGNAYGTVDLDRFLTRLHEEGVRTPAEADAARARWQQTRAADAAARGTARTVTAQQYTQRDYRGEPEINDLLDWLKDEKEREQP